MYAPIKFLGILMVWLHSHQIRPQRKAGCSSPNPRNSYVLVAVAPVEVTTKTNCISTNTRVFCGVAAIMPNKATTRKQDAALTPNKATMKNGMHLAEPS